MKMSVFIDERCESEYIKLTLSVFFQHHLRSINFSFLGKKIFLHKGILNYLGLVFCGYSK